MRCVRARTRVRACGRAGGVMKDQRWVARAHTLHAAVGFKALQSGHPRHAEQQAGRRAPPQPRSAAPLPSPPNAPRVVLRTNTNNDTRTRSIAVTVAEVEGAAPGCSLEEELARVCRLRNEQHGSNMRFKRTAICTVCQEHGAQVR